MEAQALTFTEKDKNRKSGQKKKGGANLFGKQENKMRGGQKDTVAEGQEAIVLKDP